MIDSTELTRLLALVKHRPHIDHVEGLDAFSALLEKDTDGRVLRCLEEELPKLKDKVRRGIAHVIAAHHFQKGDLTSIQKLFAPDDAAVKGAVLDVLCGEPRANPEMAPGIIALAVEATQHSSADVRGGACVLFQNQSGWKTDVSAAIEPLAKLLNDRNLSVRQPAAFAVGNLAKAKYDLSSHIAPLRRNLKHEDQFVHGSSAWALWQMSRAKHDIGAAVPELVFSLTHDEEWDEPRRNSAGALLHHAKKSASSARQVKDCVSCVSLDSTCKEITKFLEQLANLK